MASVLLVLLYFLPLIIGLSRHHHQRGPIAVVDLFLGWTLVGWVVALAMALSATPPTGDASGPAGRPRHVA